MNRRAIAVGALLAGMLAMGTTSAMLAPANRDASLVPPHLREGRWEMSVEGRQVRALTESLCGDLAAGVWLDRPDPDALPVLLGADRATAHCYETKALPAMRGADEEPVLDPPT